MTQQTTSDPVLALMDAERASFLAEVARVPAAQQARRTSPDRWSVAEIVEHVARIDFGVAKILAMHAAQPRPVAPPAGRRRWPSNRPKSRSSRRSCSAGSTPWPCVSAR